jgi:hypothetical protein
MCHAMMSQLPLPACPRHKALAVPSRAQITNLNLKIAQEHVVSSSPLTTTTTSSLCTHLLQQSGADGV